MHPLEKFKYCPSCGSSHFEINDEKSKKCNNCGFTYYINPSAATVAFIVNDNNELLVERRSREPAKGMLDLPGGFVDIDETGEEGVKREVREETGLEVIDTNFLFDLPNVYLFSGFNVHTLDLFYLCHVKTTENVKAADDAKECLWIPIDDIHTELFGLRSIRQGLHFFMQRWNKTLKK